MHTLKALDEEAVRAAAAETGVVGTLEQHSILGGLGSAVAEVLAESALTGPGGMAVQFRRVGVPSAFSPEVGSQAWLERRHGLDVAGVLAHLEGLVGATPPVE